MLVVHQISYTRHSILILNYLAALLLYVLTVFGFVAILRGSNLEELAGFLDFDRLAL